LGGGAFLIEEHGATMLWSKEERNWDIKLQAFAPYLKLSRYVLDFA
jgi:hypothetical protein